ncbi:MFS transporter [Acinetobacter baumannii]|nr:MHS family MFS transporter [Acinetobacter baumannii]EKU3427145.1 MHS family MFS transporter [Acinetobacter baumannii]ELC0777731.1 MHS family MFS transporter [Acinetobacter baumannii]ELT6483857.1 MHS family MFS transporter [Acinetobacter baumannii]EMD2446326.1 MHS family MFS transporter [Acinetobacter baumannii]
MNDMITAIEKENLSAEERKVAFATIIGTTVEWYDFIIYAAAAGLFFKDLFFTPAGSSLGTILTFATVGLSFLFRPLGAFLAGYMGDRYGRRFVLVMTLVLMGLATTSIGLLPTYESIGIWAPILLLILRILQGLAAGGEWGGAVLMAVEHAPSHKRGRFGAFPQIGVPLGLILASVMFALMTGVISPGDAFIEWGWRIPFLFSIVLLFVGHWIRRTVEESPVFEEIKQRKSTSATPIRDLFKNHALLVILAALVFAGNSACGYMTTGGFIQNYATNPEGPLALSRTPILISVTLASVVWLISTWFSGVLSDSIGRKKTYISGWGVQFIAVLTLFPLVNTASIPLIALALCFLALGIGLTYGVQSAFYSELFPASIRFSGISISYALGAILGGAFAPMIGAWLIDITGSTLAVTAYLSLMTCIAFLSTVSLKDRTGIPLGPDYEKEQSKSPVIWHHDK